jgi:pSer/pThr/pTyr-binding forkhead associated (FHA) protein
MAYNLSSLKCPQRFEELCTQLIYAEYPQEAQAVCGHGGDAGIDVLQGQLVEGTTIYQVKYFHDRLTSSRRRQIEHSLAEAAQHKPKRWVLCMGLDLTVGELKWFEGLRSQYPDIELGLWDASKLIHLLIKHDKVRQRFRLGETATPKTSTIHEIVMDEFMLYLWEEGVCTKKFKLREGATHLIGRSGKCQFQIDNKYEAVSRRHARIKRMGDNVVILDGDGASSSRHGTFVNGVPVDDKLGVILSQGDQIVLGGFKDLERQLISDEACLLTFELQILTSKG